MRVAFVSSSYLPKVGGVVLVVRRIAAELFRRGHRVQVFAGCSPAACPRWEVVDDIPVHRLMSESSLHRSSRIPRPLRFAVRVILASARLAIDLRRFRADVVSAHFVSEAALYAATACAMLRIPFVVTAHGSDLFRSPSRSRHYQRVVKVVLRRAAAVTAVSHGLIDGAISMEPSISPKSQVIPNGVDVAFFEQWKDHPPLVEYPYLLAIGNLRSVKGHDILIRSLGKVISRYPQHRLVIGGAGSMYQELATLANELGIADHLVWWGRTGRSEIARLLHGCDVLVVPSRSEGFGMVVLEAYACGKPVVASRVGGLPEIVRHGETGLLVEPENVEALAEAILSLLDCPEMGAEMGGAGRRLAANYDWDTIVDQYLEMFQSVQRSEPKC